MKKYFYLVLLVFGFSVGGCLKLQISQSLSEYQEQGLALPPTQGIKLADKKEKGTLHPVSLLALMQKEFDGRNLKLEKVLLTTPRYTRYFITYRSGGLTISGIMNVPKGRGPYPVALLNHGYIDPEVYTNGRGLKREQDYLARNGFVVLHSDYRNYAHSDKDPNAEAHIRLGYTEDVINAMYALKNSAFDFIDKQNFVILGHSMGVV